MDEQSSFEARPILGARRAGWNRLVAVIPALALLATVWLGTSGSRSGSAAKPPESAAPAAPTADAAASAEPQPGYPATVLGLDVRSVADAVGGQLSGTGPIAVGGWYVAHPALGCPRPTAKERPGVVTELGVVADTATFCDRSGVLLGWSPAGGGESTAAALFVVMTPGVVMPPAINDPTLAGAPVVLIGQVVDQATPACASQATCRELRAARLVWADGIGEAQTTSMLPRFLDSGPLLSWRPRDRLAESALGATGAILMETLVNPATLAWIDPDAAAAVEKAAPAARRIWYRLALGTDPARDKPLWVAMNDETGEVIASSPAAERTPRFPTQVLGLEVHRLDELKVQELDRDTIVAVAGWYATTAITDCPPLSDVYRPQPGAELNLAVDSWQFCERRGMFFATRPVRDGRMPTDNPAEYRSPNGGIAALPVTVTTGVVVPPALETIGTSATPVVVVGHFVPSDVPCRGPTDCTLFLVVDYLAWTLGM